MNTSLLLSFIGTVVLLALTPGPSVLLASANSMAYGTRKTIATILGDLSANLLQISLAAMGLASLIISSGEIFQLIKWGGVAYLIYLGFTKIVSKPEVNEFKRQRVDRNFKSLFWEGFLMSAANPKAIVFFAALFPLFIDPLLPFLPQITYLAITFLLIDGTSLLIYSLFANKLKYYLENQQKLHLQNKIVGILLIASGILLSMIKRSPKG